MTKEIAEKIVKGIIDKIECNTADIDDWAEFWGFTREEYEEFLDITIKVLEQEPCEDAISRSSLLGKLDDCYKEKVKVAPDNMAEGFAQVEKLIKQEPPVTPKSKTGHCEDAVSREKIEKLKRWRFSYDANTTIPKSDLFIKLADIRDLPPVTSKLKKGHWIEGQTNNPNIHNILCSCCFEGYPSKGHANSQYTREKFKYCPNCGVKMIEPQESEDKG